jgi:glycosyltransferase involved in cell wall biosynthesis
MKIVMMHNRYALSGRGSGEEVMVDAIHELLKSKGHQIRPYIRSSLELQHMTLGKARAFFSGIYNVREKWKVASFLLTEKPDCVFVQNVFPLLSPSVLVACHQAGVPVMMRCPNYRLLCPNGLLMTKGRICEKCIGGREYWCVMQNCEQDLFRSTGYALRHFVARRFSLFQQHVDVFMVLTSFARRKLIASGFAPERVQVLSALADPSWFQPASDGHRGSYAGFVGRISPEKGVDLMVEAAHRLPHIPFKIAGAYPADTPLVSHAPNNVEFVGPLNRDALITFYRDAKFIIVPSRWYEGLPAVMIEAMLCAKPIIASSIGGLPDVVDDRVTGLLFRAGDVEELSAKVQMLWNDNAWCYELGLAGRRKAEHHYSPDAFYERFMAAYDTSLTRHAKRQLHT